MNAELVASSIVLSDGVIIEHGTGKLSLIGCFNALCFSQFPSAHPGITATIGITNLKSKKFSVNITARIEDPNTGHVISSSGGKIDGELQGEVDVHQLTIDLPVRFTVIVFPAPGFYSMVVLADNEMIGKKLFLVQKLSQPKLTT